MRIQIVGFLLLILWVGFGGDGVCAAEPDVAGFKSVVAPFVARHCQRCHGEKKQESKLALHAIDGDVLNGRDIETWKSVAERLALNEMPPEGEPRPEAKTAARVLLWIKTELAKAGEDTSELGRKLVLPGHSNRADHDALFAAFPQTPTASPGRLWRMSPQIYVSYVPKVIGRGHTVGQPFSTSSGEGFKDYAGLFVVDEPTIGQLLRNAAQIVDAQCRTAQGSKPLKEFTPLLDPDREPTADQVRVAISRQFQLALLRAPTSDELARFGELLKKNSADSGRVVGAKATLAAILMLPEALYRFELGEQKLDKLGRRMLSPRELAYAISLALTDEPPDATLRKAAESGRLATREDVRREVQRMLDDKSIDKPRIMRFFEEYFEYPAAADVFKDLKRGEWKPAVLINDTSRLIQFVLNQDRDVLMQLLTTNKSFVNYRVEPRGNAVPGKAVKKVTPKIDKKTGQPIPLPRQTEIHDIYNLPEDWEWTDKQPLDLPAEQRAGILTQPSWLAAFATNDETHAIRRGKWVRERLLGGVVPDLPISVDAKLPDAPEQTMRQRMEITRQDYCWQCHRKMNPIGLAFESFDYLGRHRSTEPVLDPQATAKNIDKNGKPKGPVTREVAMISTGLIDQSGDAKLDRSFDNAVELIRHLADSPRVRQVFVRHTFRYWMGRNETLDDGPTLVAADQAYVNGGGSLKALVTALLTSDSFLYRTSK